MTVNDKAHAEYTVEDRVVRAASDEGGGGHRDQSGGKEALKCPVV